MNYRYHPGRALDNSKAIANGNLQVFVDYLRELADIPYLNHGNPEKRDALLSDRAAWARIYAEALAAHLADKDRGRPHEYFTATDAIHALEAAQEYERLKGTRLAERPEREILRRYGLSRAVLRAARKGTLPPCELPGIPSADK